MRKRSHKNSPKFFRHFVIALEDELQAGQRAALTKFVTIIASLVFWGKFRGKFGNFFRIRGEIAFCLQIAVKLCNAMLLGWLFCCGIWFRGNHRHAGVNRTEKKTDHAKMSILKLVDK